MKIVDDKKVKIDASCDFITDTIGIVLKTQEETGFGTLGLFIPRLMMGMEVKGGKKETTMTINYSKIKNSKNKMIGETSAQWRNYIEVPCLQIPNVQLPKYNVGERVYVTFADQDINSVAFLPFSVNDIKKRPVDIVDVGVSARKNDADELNDDNTYRTRYDSINQMIQIYMTKDNGEVQTYHFTIDGKNGKLSFGDEKRLFSMITKDDIFQMQDEAGAVWQMKEKTITVDCDEYIVNAKKKITMTTETMTLKNDDYTLKASNSITEESQTKKVTGKKLDEKIDSSTYKGTKSERKMSVDINNSDVVSITKFLGAAEVAWLAPAGMKGTAASPNIKNTGVANFASPAQMGRPLAVAQPTSSLLSFLGTQIDIIFGMHGCPPHATAIVAAGTPLMMSQFVKG